MKLSHIEILDFTDDHTADFAELNYQWIRKFFAVEQHDRELLDDPRKQIIDRGGRIFMAVGSGKVAGTVALIRSCDGVLELTKMAVAPGFQGCGIGHRLIEHCISFAENAGVHEIWLETHSSLAAAIHLYRAHGFIETPTDPHSLYARADVRMSLATNARDV